MIVKTKKLAISEETESVLAQFEEMGIDKALDEEELIWIDVWVNTDHIISLEEGKRNFIAIFSDGTIAELQDNPFEEK